MIVANARRIGINIFQTQKAYRLYHRDPRKENFFSFQFS